MSLNENTGAIISQELAEKFIKAFREKFGDQVVSSFMGLNNVTKILDQNGCIGLRIYNGYNDETEKICLIVVGVDEEEKDMLKGGLIYDEMATCPPICSMEGLFPKK